MSQTNGSSGGPGGRGPYTPQEIDVPLSRFAIFLVCTVNAGADSRADVRDALADVGELIKSVGFRDRDGSLACTVGIGSRVWESLTGRAQPAELHPFREFFGRTHSAPATPGDLLFHIRSGRQDICFEFERLLLDSLGDGVRVVDEVSGFRYFDTRDLLGFVDGTANPVGPELPEATVVGDEDPDFAGGSYVVVQKYVHPLPDWQSLPTEQQESIMGRTKADDVELDDAESGQKSHKTLTTITDDDGEHDIVRDNMPFGSPAKGEYGTYFIGYSRYLWVIEQMLERMFIGDPPGLHDQLLDFSTAETGTTFFAPSATLLQSLADVEDVEDADAAGDADADAADDGAAAADSGAGNDPSLGIGSLKTS
ncbi:Dyp-type peroxidase [Spelaeicoccus albus]|uniref:Putative iron-dependent peroxidase n=1 Tax=Spelaeicoccus albus TaxID=1280376 RepID=A0A7Z0D1M8_9MICO|nr:Dyp-type peroxidase [Spelaeicoccus albus]NYI66370.1 putative iron-dependent peroxidase [Spelaeicoccus albus]